MTQKILIIGNSHMSSFRRAFNDAVQEQVGKDNMVYVMTGFLKRPWYLFRLNGYLRSLRFKEGFGKDIDLRGQQDIDLVIVGEGLLGNGILGIFGKMETVPRGEEENAKSYTQKPALISGVDCAVKPKHSQKPMSERMLKFRYGLLFKWKMRGLRHLIKNGGFRSVLWVVEPDMTEDVAKCRLGEDWVESRLYSKHREIARQVFFEYVEKEGLAENIVTHPEDCIQSSGFCDNSMKSSKVASDVHVRFVFYQHAVRQVSERIGLKV